MKWSVIDVSRLSLFDIIRIRNPDFSMIGEEKRVVCCGACSDSRGAFFCELRFSDGLDLRIAAMNSGSRILRLAVKTVASDMMMAVGAFN
ncbi:MAG: hypothetical protein KME37_15665 [Candidatus Thiodiazotropha sp. (ex Codakia orbicularis)]|nr:hypothetical protein [Candidatus Thiodiazotropha sp. (ex Codakia orbicularis)]